MRAQVTYENVDFDPVTPKATEAGSGRGRSEDDEKMDFFDVPITVTAPDARRTDFADRSSAAGQMRPGDSRRPTTNAAKSRSSWTTLLDNYTFRIVPSLPQSQRQTQTDVRLPSSYLPHSPYEDNPGSNKTQRRVPSNYQPSLEDAYGGIRLTWDDFTDYRSEGDRNSRMPTLPPKPASSSTRNRRTSLFEAGKISVVDRVAIDGKPVAAPAPVVRVAQFPSRVRTRGTRLPDSPRAYLPYF